MESPSSPSSTTSVASGETASYPSSHHSAPILRHPLTVQTGISTPTSSLAPMVVPNNTPSSESTTSTEKDFHNEGEQTDLDHTLERVATALHLVDFHSATSGTPTTTASSSPSIPFSPAAGPATTATKKRHEAEAARLQTHFLPPWLMIGGASSSSIASQHYHEYSTWSWFAEEDVANSLKRLARAAKDHHLIDPSRSVEEYYSSALARVLREAEVEFDMAKHEDWERRR